MTFNIELQEGLNGAKQWFCHTTEPLTCVDCKRLISVGEAFYCKSSGYFSCVECQAALVWHCQKLSFVKNVRFRTVASHWEKLGDDSLGGHHLHTKVVVVDAKPV